MKYCNGRDFEYRGYQVKNSEREGYLNVYDNKGNYVFREEGGGHGAITSVKFKIDRLIKRYGK